MDENRNSYSPNEQENADNARESSPLSANAQVPSADSASARGDSGALPPEENPSQKRSARAKNIKKEIREWVVALAVAVLAAILIRTFLFTLIRVDGESMLDTLHNNERLFVTVLDVKLSGVERGDVVICHYPNRYSTNILGIETQTNFVKRVVGVPGDVVERKNNITYINGEALDPLNFQYYPYRPDYEPYTLGEDEYFVVGDNRYNSHDSRDWKDDDPSQDVGPITGDMIVGKARYVIWPIDAWRAIE